MLLFQQCKAVCSVNSENSVRSVLQCKECVVRCYLIFSPPKTLLRLMKLPVCIKMVVWSPKTEVTLCLDNCTIIKNCASAWAWAVAKPPVCLSSWHCFGFTLNSRPNPFLSSKHWALTPDLVWLLSLRRKILIFLSATTLQNTPRFLCQYANINWLLGKYLENSNGNCLFYYYWKGG